MGSGSQRGQRVCPAAAAKRAGASQSPLARGNQQLQAPFVRTLVLYPQGRAVPNRGGHVPAERDAHVDSPDGRHVCHRQRAGRAVQPDLPADDDRHAVHRANRHAHRVLPEHDRRDSAPLVLEGKVPMSGRMALEVADFPAQADFAKRRLVLQQLPDILVDLADFQNPFRHGAFTSYLYRLILPSASPPLPPCFPAAP